MTNVERPVIRVHPLRSCSNCVEHDEDGCAHGFPGDLVSCTAHQTAVEQEFFIVAPDLAPLVTALQAPPRAQ